jgi:transketolase
MKVAVAYTARPFPLDADTLGRIVAQDVIWVEPYLEGTSAQAITNALRERPIRLRSIGVGREELRRYGTPAEHIRAWGLDAAGLRTTIDKFLGSDPG